MTRIPRMIRQSRIGLNRAARRLAWYAIRAGFAEKLAAAFAVFDRRRGLYLRGLLAGMRRRHDDHTEFWRRAAGEFPAYADFTRQEVHAALRTGRASDAEAGLARLLEMGTVAAGDSRFVIGLTHIDRRADNGARIRGRIRNFLGKLRGNRNIVSPRCDLVGSSLRISREKLRRPPTRAAFARTF